MSQNGFDADPISNKLLAYLRNELKNPDIEFRSPLVRLEGGYETAIYRFSLDGAGDTLPQSLVLRLYPQSHGTQNAVWESAIQNALFAEGYPAAKVHFACTDLSRLGGSFLIMDYIPGQPLIFADREIVPGLTGKTHAELHQIDPAPLIRSLKEHGFDPYAYSSDARFDWLKYMAEKLPWVREGVNWLLDHRPPEPRRLSVCHGDFHPLNIMVKNGAVTGVLDWAGFVITDPVYDIANTIVLTTIPVKAISASWEGFSSVDWELAAELYCAAYQAHKALDRTNLDYYRVRRCLQALIEGYEGQKVWQHPMIIRDLMDFIQKVTGVQVAPPAPAN